MVRKKLKIGIIGAGAIVEAIHLPVLKNVQNVEVCWIFDKSAARMNLLSKMYNVPSVTESVNDAIAEIDICLLAVPYGVRKEFIETCAKMQKAVYIEKPFSVTLEEHTYYSNLFPPHKIAVGFQRRCYSINKQLQKIVENEIFGKLNRIKFIQGNFLLKGGGGHLSDATISGGGVIIESAIHILDQIIIITAPQDVSVKRYEGLSRKGIDYDSSFSSTFLKEGSEIDVSCEVTTLRNLHNGIEFEFDNVVLKSSLGIDSEVYMSGKENLNDEAAWIIKENEIEAVPKSVDQSFFIFWNKYLDAILCGEPNFTNACFSVLTSKWIDNIYKYINN